MMDETFPRCYDCEQLTEVPGSQPPPHYYYPGATTAGGRDGILVRVTPAGGRPWLGTFAWGMEGCSGIFTTPDPDRLCVVARGDGYLVTAANPTRCEALPVFPVRDVRPIPEHNLLVFASFCDLAAYGPAGLVWQSERLVLDELRINRITAQAIEGDGFGPGGQMTFSVDVETGTLIPRPPGAGC